MEENFPGVDDDLVVPEATRGEIIGGRRVATQPAKLGNLSRLLP